MPLSLNAFCGRTETASGQAQCLDTRPIVLGHPLELAILVTDIMLFVLMGTAEMLAISKVEPNSSIRLVADDEKRSRSYLNDIRSTQKSAMVPKGILKVPAYFSIT